MPAGLSLVLGEEGTGKTSVLRLLAGELPPTAGRLELHGATHDTPAYRSQVFWRDPRDPWPRETTPRAWTEEFAAACPHWQAGDWLRHVQGFALEPHLDKAMFQLSTGSQRKVLLAAALASGAPLTLIDEPVAALDRVSIRYFCTALAQVAQQPGRALVVAHYDALDEALPWRFILQLG
ncbi:ABC transporter ATP-binding protein [Melaminivora suipulveris]|nr:ATP-binding cassette domain-containing protein [Melaminivora suipulveris]